MKKLQEIPRKNIIQFCVSLLIAIIVFVVRPLGMTFQQSGVLAVTLLVIIWWALGTVPRTYASLLLLAFYLFFSGAPAKTVFTFPLSSNFLLIIFSFLFSQGISNSKLADKLLTPVLMKFCNSTFKLLLMIIFLNFIMVFVIPQPFSRIIILSAIFKTFFDKLELNPEQSSIWMLALYICSVIVNMSMLRGDIILNSSLLSMAGSTISEGTWLTYMLPPTVIYLIIALVLYCIQNKKVIKSISFRKAGTSITETQNEKTVLSSKEKIYLAFILFVVVVWALESIHGISGVIIVIAATAIMFLAGLLRLPDLKSVNVGLIIFLTGAFAIGGTLRASGAADIIFSAFARIFPGEYSLYYVLLILICAVILHMFLGSNVTTMSIVAPGMMSICAGTVSEEILIFTILIGICGHFLLPFHHVILLLGEGSGHYNTKLLMRFGILLTLLLFVAMFVLYLPWWSLIGA